MVLLCAIVHAKETSALRDIEPLSVIDYAGRTVSLSKPAERVVALAPHIVENIFSAGAGDLLVGRVDYSDYPEKAKDIPSVGSLQGFSLEVLVALNPDLVITWKTGLSNNLPQKLLDLGFTVYFDEPRLLDDIAKSITDIGILTGRIDSSEKASQIYLKRLSDLKQTYGDREEVSLFYQVWGNPLYTINDQHIVSDVINLCSGRNIFADGVIIAPKVSVESVINRNPEVIIASGQDGKRSKWLDDWLQWKTIEAVQQSNLFFIHPDLLQRHTIRILDGAEQMCQQLDSVRRSSIKNS